MRLGSLVVLAMLALVLPAANADAAKTKHVRVVKRHGAITATLTYTVTPTGADKRITLAVRRHGRVLLRHHVVDQGPMTPSLSFRYVAGKRVPAAVVETFLSTSIALVSPRQVWIVHDWDRYRYRGRQVGGRYYANMWVPARSGRSSASGSSW